VLSAYLNYPNSRVSVHGNPRCGHIQQARKAGQRHVLLEPRTIGSQLRRFIDRTHTFGAEAARNDMWLYIDFAEDPFEVDLARYIHRLLGARYKRFRDAPFQRHC